MYWKCGTVKYAETLNVCSLTQLQLWKIGNLLHYEGVVHVKSSLSIQEQKTEVLMPFIRMLHAVLRWDIEAALCNRSMKQSTELKIIVSICPRGLHKKSPVVGSLSFLITQLAPKRDFNHTHLLAIWMCNHNTILFYRYTFPKKLSGLSNAVTCTRTLSPASPTQKFTLWWWVHLHHRDVSPSLTSHCGANISPQRRQCCAKYTLSAMGGRVGRTVKMLLFPHFVLPPSAKVAWWHRGILCYAY